MNSIKKISVWVILFILNIPNIGVSQNFQYDLTGRLTKVTYPDSTVIDYCYDAVGNRTCQVVTQQVIVVPDIYVHDLAATPSSLCQEAQFSLNFQVENLSNADAGNFNNRIVLSSDQTYQPGTDILLANKYTNSLAANTINNTQQLLQLPAGLTPGSYYILVVADYENAVQEISETNNLGYVAVSVNASAGFTLAMNTLPDSCELGVGAAWVTVSGGAMPYQYEWSNTQQTNAINQLPSGLYYVSVTDASGCTEIGQAAVMSSLYNPAPSFGYSKNGLTVTFTNTTPNASGFLWQFGDAATSTLEAPMHTYAAEGVYNVCLEAENGCGTAAFCLDVNLTTLDPGDGCNNSAGEENGVLYQKTYDFQEEAIIYCVAPTADGGSLDVHTLRDTAAVTESNIALTRKDRDGNILWTKTVYDSLTDWINDIKELDNGHFLFCGYTENHGAGDNDGMVGELSACGDFLWVKTYGGAQFDRLYEIIPASATEYIVVGRTTSFGAGDSDIMVLKINLEGDLIWAKTYGGPQFESGRSIIVGHQFTSHKYLIGGQTSSFPASPSNNDRALFLTLNEAGDYQTAAALRSSTDDGSLLAEKIVEFRLPFYGTYFYTLAGITTNSDIFNDLSPHYENGFMATVNISGNPNYARFFQDMRIQDMTVDSTRGYYIVGKDQICQIKDDLTINWSKKYGGLGTEYLYAIEHRHPDTLFAAGLTESFGGQIGWSIKMDSLGNTGCNEYAYTQVNNNIEPILSHHYPSAGQFTQNTITNLITVTEPILYFEDGNAPIVYQLCPNDTCQLQLAVTPQLSNICAGSQITFNANAPYASKIDWYLNGNLVHSGESFIHLFNTVGNEELIVRADNAFCMVADTLSITIDPTDSDIALLATVTHATDYAAATGAVNLTVQNNPGPYTYQWSSGEQTEDLSNIPAGSYTVTVTYNNSCIVTANYAVLEYPNIAGSNLPLFNLYYQNQSLGNTQVVRYNANSYLVAANSGTYNVFLLVDNLGVVKWIKRYNINIPVQKFKLLSNGHFAVLNQSKIAYFNTTGDLLWAKTFPSILDLRDVDIFSNGELIFTGSVTSSSQYNNQSFILMGRMSPTGDLLWVNSIGDAGEPNSGIHIKVRNNQAYILGGTYSWGDSFANLADLVMVNVGVTGTINWVRTTGVRESGDENNDWPVDFDFLSDGRIAVLDNNANYVYSVLLLSSTFSSSNWVKTYSEFHQTLTGISVNTGNKIGISGGKLFSFPIYRKQLLAQFSSTGILEWANQYDLLHNSFFGKGAVDVGGAYVFSSGNYLSKISATGASACGNENITSTFLPISSWNPYTVHSTVSGYSSYVPALTLTTISGNSPATSTNRTPLCVTCAVNTTFSASDTDICANGMVTFTPADNALDDYFWLVDGRQISRSASYQHTFLSVGTYEVGLIGRKGICLDTTYLTIQVGNSDILLIQADSVVQCGGATLQVADAGLGYLWSTGATTQSISVTNAGSYSVVVTDTDGCTYSDSIQFTKLDYIELTYAKADVSCNEDNDGAITLVANLGTPPYSALWSNGQSGLSASGLPGGTYHIVVTDALGCSDSVDVAIYPSPAVLLFVEQTNCFESGSGSIATSIVGGQAPYIYRWNNGSAESSLTALGPGYYSVQVSESGGCVFYGSASLGSAPLISQSDTTICPGDTITLTVNGAENRVISMDQAGEYIQVSNHPSISITGNLTIEMWLFPTSFSGNKNPIAKAQGGEYAIVQNPDGRLTFYWGTSGTDAGPFQSFQTNGSLQLNTWNHIALVRDITGNKVSWYLNGVLDHESSGLTVLPATAGSANLRIGDGNTGPYTGKIDEIRIWDTALDSAAIHNWRYRTVNFQHPDALNLQAYYTLDGQSGATDHSSNSNDGSILSTVDILTDTLDIKNSDLQWSNGQIGGSLAVAPQNTTTYTVTYSGDGAYCTAQVMVQMDTLAATRYADTDGDGYGDPYNTAFRCPETGWVTNSQDCDDTNPGIYPGAQENCDGIDNNCDGQIDEGVLVAYFLDADGDGFGNPLMPFMACSLPMGYVSNSSDCDDTSPVVNPLTIWYSDLDGDGYGDATADSLSCLQPDGFVLNTDDCSPLSGAVHPGDLNIEEKFTAPDTGPGDALGAGVAINHQYALAGAPHAEGNNANSGACYIYRKNGGSWLQPQKLQALDGTAGDKFGFSVSIWGDYAIVGAPEKDDNGSNSGAAYVFFRNGNTWQQQAKLNASDAQAEDFFGYAVSIHGDYALVGAFQDGDGGQYSGSAYVFHRVGNTWQQEAKLVAADADVNDQFGYSVSLYGDEALIGAFGDSEYSEYAGAAYIFERSGTAWTQQTKLTASDAGEYFQFGTSVSLEADRAAIGSPGENAGAAYLFEKVAGTWTEKSKIVPADGAIADSFGNAISLKDGALVVGSPSDDDNGDASGSAYIYLSKDGIWKLFSKIKANDATMQDNFGVGVAIDSMNVLVGAPADDVVGVNSGSVYFFEYARKLPVNLKAILQGPYNPTSLLMNDHLRLQGRIPAKEPYTSLGFAQVNGGGECVKDSLQVFQNVTGNNAIVDWVFVQLRNKSNPSQVIATRSGLIQRDGDIVDVDGVSPLLYSALFVKTDSVFVAIRHRNHLTVRSSAKIGIDVCGTGLYDFSAAQAQAYQNQFIASNTAQTILPNGTYSMWRCNVNGDNFINLIDVILSKSQSTPNQTGIYLGGDVNMDGHTNVLDHLLTRAQSTPNKTAHQ